MSIFLLQHGMPEMMIDYMVLAGICSIFAVQTNEGDLQLTALAARLERTQAASKDVYVWMDKSHSQSAINLCTCALWPGGRRLVAICYLFAVFAGVGSLMFCSIPVYEVQLNVHDMASRPASRHRRLDRLTSGGRDLI